VACTEPSSDRKGKLGSSGFKNLVKEEGASEGCRRWTYYHVERKVNQKSHASVVFKELGKKSNLKLKVRLGHVHICIDVPTSDACTDVVCISLHAWRSVSKNLVGN
jgi:hypothetical protein